MRSYGRQLLPGRIYALLRGRSCRALLPLKDTLRRGLDQARFPVGRGCVSRRRRSSGPRGSSRSRIRGHARVRSWVRSCRASKQEISTDLPPLSLAIVSLEKALIVGNSVLAIDPTAIPSATAHLRRQKLQQSFCKSVNSPPLLLACRTEHSGSGSLHQASGGRCRHFVVVRLWQG
jgi:hypothetical protein